MGRTFVTLKQHDTPYTVYAVTFSPDGQRLAYAGGFFYGQGYVFCIDRGGEGATFWGSEGRRDTISNLCFDRTGDFIAASAWAKRHGHYPGLIFQVCGDRTPRWIFAEDAEDIVRTSHGPSTGVSLHEGRMVVRRSASPENTISSYALPPEVDSSNLPYHLTSSRLVVLPGIVLTGICRRVWIGNREESTIGLLAAIHEEGRAPVTKIFSSPHDGEISAITADASRALLVTCGSDGSVAFWRYELTDGFPSLEILSVRQGHSAEVSAACFMSQGALATADRNGGVRLWVDDKVCAEWTIDGWSPRAMASHPVLPRLAVGCKHGPAGGREGCVFLVAVAAGAIYDAKGS